VQNPVVAERRASAATIPPSAAATGAAPSAPAIAPAPVKTAPTWLAKRGGRLSSSGPSPHRGCTSSK